VCPNNREFLPKRRPKKGAPAEAAPATPECTYERKIGPPKVVERENASGIPDAEKTRAVVAVA
jgi:DNA topoisomerase-1